MPSSSSEQIPTYHRHPAVKGDTLLLVTDGDVFAAPLAGGRAFRLTDGRTEAAYPVPSPNGRWLAYTARDEQHPEAFVMPLEGGPAERISHLGASITASRAWRDDDTVVVATNHALPFARDSQLVAVNRGAADAVPLRLGSAHEIAYGPGARVLLGRHTTNQGRWKRYRGGTAGQLWIDADGDGRFERLLSDLSGDLGSAMLIGERAWFISDHDGVGNVYSCALDGGDLTRHTDHVDYYARHATTDGETIVYACGGDVYRLMPGAGDGRGPRRVDVRVTTPRARRARRFVDPSRWLHSYAVHPEGTHVALRVRGRPFTMGLWDGPVTQHGARDGVNHRLVRWLPDGQRLVLLSDADGEERLEVHGGDGGVARYDHIDLGVPLEMTVSPVADVVAVTDQQGRLRVIDLDSGGVTEVTASPYGVDRPAWSPDGRWLAWSHRESNWYTASIRLWCTSDGLVAPGVVVVTDGRHAHRAPAFDPDGRYLYWVASTRFDPVADGVYFDHGFPMPDVILAAVLAEDGRAPLDRDPRPPGTPPPRPAAATPSMPDPAGPPAHPDPRLDEGADDADADDEKGADDDSGEADGEATAPPVQPPPRVTVDVDGLADRIVRLPFPTGRYVGVAGLRGKVVALARPLRPTPLIVPPPKDRRPEAQIESLDLDSGRHDVLVSGVSSFALSADSRTMVYAVRRRLRAIRAGTKPKEGPGVDPRPGPASGWLDLGRVSVSVQPPQEWRQMFLEAWRLQRELFWSHDMSGVDWDAVRERYVQLIDRISTRSELSDLIWEMFGELGTGHAYERGGDHPVPPRSPQGHLGADISFDRPLGAWVVDRVLSGDVADPQRMSPLRAPGVRVGAGARLLAVDGQVLDADLSPAMALVNRADREIELRVADPEPRSVTVRTLPNDTAIRYVDWVASNAAAVAEASQGRLGYVHIPDMGRAGYAEFHRQYLHAAHADGLIVDVRFNGGGNVSPLLLEKLAGRRIGYQLRRTGALEPYPHHAPAGPLVAITNERCGSDGDIFTHAWKRLELGPVVGTRTWGGVIGIMPRNPSVDGTVTTQPAFAFWFDDVGWGVENYGTDPTHPVDIAPHDAASGVDPQLDRAVQLALAALEEAQPPPRPDPSTAPRLGSPG